MILYADLYYNKKEVLSAPLELNVEFNYTPNDLWIIGIHEKEDGENFQLLYYRKVLQIIHGNVLHNNKTINIVAAQYIHDNSIATVIIQGECQTDGNYYVYSTDGLIELETANRYLLIDGTEIKIIPEFNGRPLVESIETIILNHSSYTDLFRFYKLDSNKIVNQIEFNKM